MIRFVVLIAVELVKTQDVINSRAGMTTGSNLFSTTTTKNSPLTGTVFFMFSFNVFSDVSSLFRYSLEPDNQKQYAAGQSSADKADHTFRHIRYSRQSPYSA